MTSLTGTSSNDTLQGGTGNDALVGLGGNDRLVGYNGDDFLDGGDGNDILVGGWGNDSVFAGSGSDCIYLYDSYSDADTVSGGADQDTFKFISSINGSTTITDFAAGAGGDILDISLKLKVSTGYTGGNPFDAGLGYLRLVQSGTDTELQWDPDGDAGSASGWRTIATLQNLDASTLTAENFTPPCPSDGSSTGVTLTGAAGNDTLLGGVVNDTLYGLDGDDSLEGYGGDDLLDGGDGWDYLFGGSGNDTLLFDGGSGLGEDGDDSMVGGSGNDNFHGNNGNDTLSGGNGKNWLTGGNGNDSLTGGNGNDSLEGGFGSDLIDAGAGSDHIKLYCDSSDADTVSGGAGPDTFLFSSTCQGSTTITDFAAGTDGDVFDLSTLLSNSSGYASGNPFDASLGYLRLGQSAADAVLQWDRDGNTGSDHVWQTLAILQNLNASNLTADNFSPATTPGAVLAFNLIQGSAGSDSLDGAGEPDFFEGRPGDDRSSCWAGNDTLAGGDGNDWLHGNMGDDHVMGGAGSDTVMGGKDADFVAGGEGNDLVRGGMDNDMLHGGGGNDTLLAGKGADQLFGDAGDDYLDSRLGNDTMTGGGGADLFVFASPLDNTNNVDTITDYTPGEDHILLDPLLFLSSGHIIVDMEIGDLFYVDYEGTPSFVKFANIGDPGLFMDSGQEAFWIDNGVVWDGLVYGI